MMNAIVENLVDSTIREALARHHIPYSSRLAAEVRSHIQVGWLRDNPVITAVDDSGLAMSVYDYIGAAKFDPQYASKLVPSGSEMENPTMGPPRISLSDQASMTANLERIARGELEVVDER